MPKCKDLHDIATLIQSESSGNIHAGGEPTCPAAGQAQTRVTLKSLKRVRLFYKWGVAPCQVSGCIISTQECPQPARRTARSPCALSTRNRRRGREHTCGTERAGASQIATLPDSQNHHHAATDANTFSTSQGRSREGSQVRHHRWSKVVP